MAKLTIAQQREKAIDRLVSYKTSNPTEEDYAQARRLMNSYYRLFALSERNLIYTNDAQLYNLPWVAESEEKEERWYKRLNKEFNTFNLCLAYTGPYPDIFIRKGNGVENAYLTYYYN